MKLAVLSSIIAVASAIEGVKMLKSPAGVNYALVSAGATRDAAADVCAKLGGKLADVGIGAEFEFLATEVKGAAWINTFQQKSFDGACFAFFEGGAIAVPLGNCASEQSVLCEL